MKRGHAGAASACGVILIIRRWIARIDSLQCPNLAIPQPLQVVEGIVVWWRARDLYARAGGLLIDLEATDRSQVFSFDLFLII